MEGSATHSGRSVPKDLSKAPGFRLGPLTVEPPSRYIGAGGRSEMLEPRVMRVLVALGMTPGTVLSRDDLIELCWDGNIVGDNAIDRVISRLRHVIDDLASGAVRLETITKVGFRIVCETRETAAGNAADSPVEVAQPVRGPRLSRRVALGGLAVAAAGSALAYVGWNRTARPEPDPRAREFYQQGQFLVKTGEIGTVRKALDLYKQAVTIDPEYADAWGAMAISYIHYFDGLGPREKLAAPELARSAAERALSLDSDQPDAQLALATPLPHFHRWFEHEKRLRDIVRRHPDYWCGHGQLGILLLDVGRAGEAAERYRRVLELEPMLPNYWVRFAGALKLAGREQEADIAFDEALARWPTNWYVRVNRFTNYLDSKRYGEAVAFLRDPRNYPEDVPPEAIARGLRWAEALASGTGFAEHIEYVRRQMAQSPNADLTYTATVLFWFGAVDLAFEALQASYLGGMVESRRFAPPAALARRTMVPLFSNTVLAHRDDPRYASILQRSGLEDYWRKSGTEPDFRKS
jgi:DNA-binding winged helix-turn-helix (wHTH) protein/tetratricopeptide (TPR) repeat protein